MQPRRSSLLDFLFSILHSQISPLMISLPRTAGRLIRLPTPQRSLLKAPPDGVIRRFADDAHGLDGVRDFEDAHGLAVSPTGAAVGIFDVNMFGSEQLADVSQLTRLVAQLHDQDFRLGDR